MAIQFSKLPGWAKRAIEKAGEHGTTQINQSGVTLSVIRGVAHFNGQRVVKEGEVAPEEEVIRLADLPSWAQKKIRHTGSWSQVQVAIDGHSLQINVNGAFFDGKKVVS